MWYLRRKRFFFSKQKCKHKIKHHNNKVYKEILAHRIILEISFTVEIKVTKENQKSKWLLQNPRISSVKKNKSKPDRSCRQLRTNQNVSTSFIIILCEALELTTKRVTRQTNMMNLCLIFYFKMSLTEALPQFLDNKIKWHCFIRLSD